MYIYIYVYIERERERCRVRERERDYLSLSLSLYIWRRASIIHQDVMVWRSRQGWLCLGNLSGYVLWDLFGYLFGDVFGSGFGGVFGDGCGYIYIYIGIYSRIYSMIVDEFAVCCNLTGLFRHEVWRCESFLGPTLPCELRDALGWHRSGWIGS